MKKVDYSKTIAACDLKLIDLVSEIVRFSEIVSIEGQGHLLTLAQGHLHLKIETCFSQKPLGYF